MLQTLNTVIISILNKSIIMVECFYRILIFRFCSGEGPIYLHETMKYKNKHQLLGIKRKYSSISRK